MTNRPDWNEWILQKNAEHETEELKKSDSVILEKGKQRRGDLPEDFTIRQEKPLKPLKGYDKKGRMIGAQGVAGHGEKPDQEERPRKTLGREHLLPEIDPVDHPKSMRLVNKQDIAPALPPSGGGRKPPPPRMPNPHLESPKQKPNPLIRPAKIRKGE